MKHAMKSLRVAAAGAVGLLALAATPALAAPLSGYVTANVNQRSGPSTAYPPIVVIPAGSRITIYGCLSDDSWCDISWGPNRGWMYSAYLQVSYQARRIPLQSYSGVPFITFNFGPYWDSHYKNRPFFNQRGKWSNFRWQNGQNNPPPKPMPPKPPQNTGNQNNPPPVFGNPNKPPKFGNGQFGNGQFGNGQQYNNGPKGPPPSKNCKWINDQWVCKAPTP
jgi:uncharacterized protein YraI